jgi:hypothetical protein
VETIKRSNTADRNIPRLVTEIGGRSGCASSFASVDLARLASSREHIRLDGTTFGLVAVEKAHGAGGGQPQRELPSQLVSILDPVRILIGRCNLEHKSAAFRPDTQKIGHNPRMQIISTIKTKKFGRLLIRFYEYRCK